MNKIIMVTLNSAIEEVVFADAFLDKKIHNAHKVNRYYTGKAVNTGLVLSNMACKTNMYVVCGPNSQNAYENMHTNNC